MFLLQKRRVRDFTSSSRPIRFRIAVHAKEFRELHRDFRNTDIYFSFIKPTDARVTYTIIESPVYFYTFRRNSAIFK
jgi:hypothetical protein